MTQLLSDKSWQYRQLNAVTPGLNALSDALLDLVNRGEPIVAGTADLQYSNGLSKFAKLCPRSLRAIRYCRTEYGQRSGRGWRPSA